jgi:hypothetical protein
MMKSHHYCVLYFIMNLPQLERIKTELEQRNYGQNKIIGTYLQLTIDFRGEQTRNPRHIKQGSWKDKRTGLDL